MYYNKFKTTKAIITYSEFEGLQSTVIHLMVIPDKLKTLDCQMKVIQESFKEFLQEKNCCTNQIAFQRYFVSDFTNQSAIINQNLFSQNDSSISLVQQSPLNGSKVGLWAVIFKGNDGAVFSKQKENNKLVLEHNGYLHYFSTQIHSQIINGDSYLQTKDIFKNYIGELKNEGLTLEDHCIRTWFYVRDIDNNYMGLVKARNEVFKDCNLTKDTHFISSTGIEGRYADPEISVLMDAYSIGGIKGEQIHFIEAKEYLNPTHEYGVAFERGTAIDYGDQRQVFISGTASINTKGDVVFENDIINQTNRVFENIKALLSDVDARLNDIASMIVYLRDISDYSMVEEFLTSNYSHLPYIIVFAPVCRPGWLIEVECIAIKKIINSAYLCF